MKVPLACRWGLQPESNHVARSKGGCCPDTTPEWLPCCSRRQTTRHIGNTFATRWRRQCLSGGSAHQRGLPVAPRMETRLGQTVRRKPSPPVFNHPHARYTLV